jgi:hypothetical protein
MNPRRKAAWLIVVQCVVICTVAGKYWYERATLPRIWVRAAQVDPDSLVRGRYLMLDPLINACKLPRNEGNHAEEEEWDYSVHPPRHIPGRTWEWWVTTQAVNGQLAVKDVAPSRYKAKGLSLLLREGKPCDRAQLQADLALYVPEKAVITWPSQNEGDVWVEVTVPKAGLPRPIQLATEVNGKWQLVAR